MNAVAVTGTLIGTGGSTCWGPSSNTNYRANVTAQVTGNGAYVIGGLPSSTAGVAADTDDAALVVVYQVATAGTRRRVLVRDGAITTDTSGEVVSDTFAGLAVPFAGPGRFHLAVGDGQSTTDGALTFAGTTVGTNQFAGSDGALWDVNSYTVSMSSGQTSAT